MKSHFSRQNSDFGHLTNFQFNFFQPYLGASQFHWLSDRLGPQRDLHFLCHDGCQDPFRALPSLLVTKIIGYLEPSTLNRCRQVCHFWNNLFDSQWIWQKLCFRPEWKLSQSESQVQLERHHKTNGLSWRAIFRERYKLKRSWLTGKYNLTFFFNFFFLPKNDSFQVNVMSELLRVTQQQYPVFNLILVALSAVVMIKPFAFGISKPILHGLL